MIQNVPRGPTKNQSFGFALVFLLTTFLMIWLATATGVQLCGCTGWLTFLLTLVYGVIWYRKFDGDNRAADQAIQQRYEPVDQEFGGRARPTTPGSGYIGLDGLDQLQPPESV